jgi:hypothetical protein
MGSEKVILDTNIIISAYGFGCPSFFSGLPSSLKGARPFHPRKNLVILSKPFLSLII